MSDKGYILVLRPLPSDALHRTPEMRLRAALKALLRGYGLRCIEVRPVISKPEGSADKC